MSKGTQIEKLAYMKHLTKFILKDGSTELTDISLDDYSVFPKEFCPKLKAGFRAYYLQHGTRYENFLSNLHINEVNIGRQYQNGASAILQVFNNKLTPKTTLAILTFSKLTLSTRGFRALPRTFRDLPVKSAEIRDIFQIRPRFSARRPCTSKIVRAFSTIVRARTFSDHRGNFMAASARDCPRVVRDCPRVVCDCPRVVRDCPRPAFCFLGFLLFFTNILHCLILIVHFFNAMYHGRITGPTLDYTKAFQSYLIS